MANSEHPPTALLAEALKLPVQDRLALATELLNAVEGTDDDADWDASWLDELDRRAANVAADPTHCQPWHVVRDRMLAELRRK